MATTGAKYPSYGASFLSAPYDDNDWVSASNITANDGSYANITAKSFDTDDYTYLLRAYTFDFSEIGDSDTIDGIIVRFERHATDASSVSTVFAQLYNGSFLGTQKNFNLFDYWPTTDGVQTIGTSTDKWGTTGLTGADVKAAAFGVTIGARARANDAEAYVDYITMEVYYTAAGTETSSTRSARIEGFDTASSTRPARTEGFDTASSSRAARTSGKETTSSERAARIEGYSNVAVVDSYSESEASGWIGLGAGTYWGYAQSFAGDGSNLYSAKFYLYRYGNGGTGDILASLYAHDGTWGSSGKPSGSVLAVSNVIAASDIEDSVYLQEFFFTGVNQVALTADHYCIVIEYVDGSGDASNFIRLAQDDPGDHAGNAAYYTSAWYVDASTDIPFYVYGTSAGTSASSERPARTEGYDTASSERPARIEGFDTASSERAARTVGKSTVSSERPARIEGWDTASSERAARTEGFDTAASERPARIEGQITTSSERAARIEGTSTGTQTSSERAARTEGYDIISSERPARTEGFDTAESERPARTEGFDIAESERAARVEGFDTASSERAARTSGHITVSSERAARIEGFTTGTQASSERPARTEGWDTANSERGARTEGFDSASSERAARAEGCVTIGSARPARTEGYDVASSERASRIEGCEGVFSERGARTEGQQTVDDERSARTAGYDIESSERAARTKGGHYTSSTRSARTEGYRSARGEDVLYSEIRNLVRWMSKDVEGLKITDNLLAHYIIDGQRFITRRLKLPEFYTEMEMTYTASATSVTLPTTVGWFYSVEIDDGGDRTPVPVVPSDDKVKQANQPSGTYYCYLVGRDLYLRTEGEVPSAAVTLKLFGVPLIPQPLSDNWSWSDELGVTSNTIPDHFRELLIQYLMWKLRIATATKEEHFNVGAMWRREFMESMAMYSAERSGVGRMDSIYTTFGKDVLS